MLPLLCSPDVARMGPVGYQRGFWVGAISPMGGRCLGGGGVSRVSPEREDSRAHIVLKAFLEHDQ